MPEKTLVLESQGYKIYAVDGDEVRSDFSVAFSGGDNWSHNAKIPKGEVWIEKSLKGSDRDNIVLHELVEAELMANFDMDYDEAHLVANTIESFVRKTEDLPTALATLAESTGLSEDAVAKINAAYTELGGTKEAADVPVHLGGAGPVGVEPPVARRDPYETYLSDVLSSPTRRENVFNLATGSRFSGLRGLRDQAAAGYGEYSSMSALGLEPGSKEFREGITGALKSYMKRPGGVEAVFGRVMSPTEAIAAIGIKDLPKLPSLASDPMTWAKAFGKGAKTPTEQARARKLLHAAMSLYSGTKAFAFDPKNLQLAFSGIPFHVQRAYKRPMYLRETPDGLKALPSIKDVLSQPTLTPKYYLDNLEAARNTAKMGSAADVVMSKVAEHLPGTYSTAKHQDDPEDHLYHVEKNDAGVVMGMVKVSPKPEGTYHITNFWVRPGSRSQGIGTRLMKRVLELYSDKTLTLDSEVFDKSPLTQAQLDAFYEKFDFVKTTGQRMIRHPAEKQAKWLQKGVEGVAGLLSRTSPGTKALRSLPSYTPSQDATIRLGQLLSKWRHYNKPQYRQATQAMQRRGLLNQHDELTGAGFEPKSLRDYLGAGGFAPKTGAVKEARFIGPALAKLLSKAPALNRVGLHQAARSVSDPQYARLAAKNLAERLRTGSLSDAWRHYAGRLDAPAAQTPLRRPVLLGSSAPGAPQTTAGFYKQMDLAQGKRSPRATRLRETPRYKATPEEHEAVWRAEGVPRPVNPKPFPSGMEWHYRHQPTEAQNWAHPFYQNVPAPKPPLYSPPRKLPVIARPPVRPMARTDTTAFPAQPAGPKLIRPEFRQTAPGTDPQIKGITL